jgi:hypothetical protein
MGPKRKAQKAAQKRMEAQLEINAKKGESTGNWGRDMAIARVANSRLEQSGVRDAVTGQGVRHSGRPSDAQKRSNEESFRLVKKQYFEICRRSQQEGVPLKDFAVPNAKQLIAEACPPEQVEAVERIARLIIGANGAEEEEENDNERGREKEGGNESESDEEDAMEVGGVLGTKRRAMSSSDEEEERDGLEEEEREEEGDDDAKRIADEQMEKSVHDLGVALEKLTADKNKQALVFDKALACLQSDLREEKKRYTRVQNRDRQRRKRDKGKWEKLVGEMADKAATADGGDFKELEKLQDRLKEKTTKLKSAQKKVGCQRA